jgi:hypothetical protein
MSADLKLALTEAVKELLRTGILGGTSAALTVVLTGIDTQSATLNINWAAAGVVFLATSLTALQRAIDRFMHIWGRETKSETKGLIGF